MEIVLGLVLMFTAAVVGVWRIASRDKPIHGPGRNEPLVLPQLQHWSEGYQQRRFDRIRRSFPRMEISPIFLVGSAALLVIVIAGSAFVMLRDQGSAPSASERSNTLGDIISTRAEANAATDPEIAYQLLVDAQIRLQSLINSYPPSNVDQALVDEYASVTADIDSLTSVSRLDNIQVVGRIPAAPDGRNAKLFAGGGNLFAFSDALYQVDTIHSSLVRLLSAGDIVEDSEVGTLLGAAWREDGPIAVDAYASYVLELELGRWTREPLATYGEVVPYEVSSIEVFDFNLYVLDTENGQILKFAGGDYESPPDVWTSPNATSDLLQSKDFTVDGNIYVALEDGRILTYFLSERVAEFVPHSVPPVESANGLVANLNGQYFYLLCGSDGRILRLDRNGNLIQQLIPGQSTIGLDGLTDLVIDEDTAIAYILLSNGNLYTTRLPDPVQTH